METVVTTLMAIGLVNLTFGITLVTKTRKRNVFIHIVVGFLALVFALYFGDWDLTGALMAYKHPDMNPWIVVPAFLIGFIPFVLLDVDKRSAPGKENNNMAHK